MHGHTLEARQQVECLKCLVAAARMNLVDHYVLSRCAVHPPQLRAHAHAGLVEVHHRRLQQRLAQRLHHRFHSGVGLRNGGMHAGRGHRHAKQVLHQVRASLHRHMLILR